MTIAPHIPPNLVVRKVGYENYFIDIGYCNREGVQKAYPPPTRYTNGWGCLAGIGVGKVAIFYAISSDISQDSIRRVRGPRKSR